jgi:15-cis-phytoene synthase
MHDDISKLLQQVDKDRWLACLLAPEAKRAHLLALYAFNFEIARIRETVSEPGLGEIRLQFWSDNIEALYAGQSPQHPIAEALKQAIDEAGLSKQGLLNLIEARRFDLYDDPMPDMQSLEGYLGETASILFMMAAQILNGGLLRDAADAAGFAGVAYGLHGLLLSAPIHARRGQLYLPGDILSRHGVSAAEARSGRDSEAMWSVHQALCGHIFQRLDEARLAIAKLPREIFPAFLPLAIIKPNLKALEKAKTASQLQRQWHLWKASLLGKI